MPVWLANLLPIVVLLAVVAAVLARVPPVAGVTFSPQFRRRRLLNWLPLGLCYAFLYMGRYNLTVAKDAFDQLRLWDDNNSAFALVFAAGTWVYGLAFVVNGPLTDRFGGKVAILLSAGGSALCNGLLGMATAAVVADHDAGVRGFCTEHALGLFAALYGANMYFQSFGAVAVVKVNAPWFHLRERGVFGAIFGILISLGLYFAFDWGNAVREALPLPWVFWVPALVLVLAWSTVLVVVRNSPAAAGLADFDTGDASTAAPHHSSPVAVFGAMLRNPVIVTIAAIEFCSGFLRQSVMQWYRTFAKQTGGASGLVYDNWGLVQCMAGILGGVVAGVISDRLFQSRRGPVAALLYAAMALVAVLLTFTYQTPLLSGLVVVMSLCVIGVHGMLSGTASMDFAGRHNAGVAVGIIDGFVYAGTGCMALAYSAILPNGALAKDPAHWLGWPLAMVPVAAVGLALSLRVWHATPKRPA